MRRMKKEPTYIRQDVPCTTFKYQAAYPTKGI